jgi:hypothetical protein
MADLEAIPFYRFRTNESAARSSRDGGHHVEDAQSGYRVVATDVLRKLDLNARGYIIETEILLKASPHVRRFRHVPIRAIYGGRRTTGLPGYVVISWGRCTTRFSRWTRGPPPHPGPPLRGQGIFGPLPGAD